ncbi:MAG: tRNA uridine-5-carboxymethylaminomethyl(34) synthesis GTPase MnmE [Armatimonadota bacterium]
MDTIAAIATAIGSCGIGVIRISGPDAFSIGDRLFVGNSGTPSTFKSHTVHYGSLVHPANRELIDKILLTVFKAPASYTGDDTIEISCHGGIVTLGKALEAAYDAGALPAGPGEFTKRAFLNGRLDLAQAEAVNDIIRARTDYAQRQALRQLGSALSSEVSKITDAILSILARIEAAIDFPEDVEEPNCHILSTEIKTLAQNIDYLISTSDRGRIYREGISLAIIGRPNVGKSSLLNALLGQDRAIVTHIPGTTRDVIEESINIRGIPVIAADTAGLRTAADEVEKIGVELTERTMAAAGLILFVIDASTGFTDEDRKILSGIQTPVLIVLNKIDLLNDQDKPDALKQLHREFPNIVAIPISATTGLGIEELEDKIAETVMSGKAGSGEGSLVTNLRHKQALIAAKECLEKALITIEHGLPIDFLSVDLIAARMSLGDITGDTASADLIDRIFEDFCIGK